GRAPQGRSRHDHHRADSGRGGGEIRVGAAASWPGLSRPSTPCFAELFKDVDARHKAGHDDQRDAAPHSVHSRRSGNPVLTHNWVPTFAGTNGEWMRTLKPPQAIFTYSNSPGRL